MNIEELEDYISDPIKYMTSFILQYTELHKQQTITIPIEKLMIFIEQEMKEKPELTTTEEALLEMLTVMMTLPTNYFSHKSETYQYPMIDTWSICETTIKVTYTNEFFKGFDYSANFIMANYCNPGRRTYLLTPDDIQMKD